jgi:hypothetical protein
VGEDDELGDGGNGEEAEERSEEEGSSPKPESAGVSS